jgi:hypothetical protein
VVRGHSLQERMRGQALLHALAWGFIISLLDPGWPTALHAKTLAKVRPVRSSVIAKRFSFFAIFAGPAVTVSGRAQFLPSEKQGPPESASLAPSGCVRRMDYLVVLISCAFVAAHALFVGRRLPRE